MLEHDLQVSTTSNLTQSQLLIWTGQQLSPNVPLYNMVHTFDFKGSIDVDHFQNAFQTLVDKSDAMRTVFNLENSIPQQKILDSLSYKLDFLDWSDKVDSKAELQKWLDVKTQITFDLSKILFDSVLIKFSDEKFIWYLNQHHLITDGWSISVQYKMLAEIYGCIKNGVSTGEIKIPSFCNFVDFEKITGKRLCDSSIKKYWNEKLDSIPKPPKLYGHISEENTTETTRTTISIGTERADKLRKLVSDKKISLLTSELTIFNIFATILLKI